MENLRYFRGEASLSLVNSKDLLLEEAQARDEQLFRSSSGVHICCRELNDGILQKCPIVSEQSSAYHSEYKIMRHDLEILGVDLRFAG